MRIEGSVVILDNETVGREAIEAGMRESLATSRFVHLIEDDGLIGIDGDRAIALSTIEIGMRHASDHLRVIFGRFGRTRSIGAGRFQFRVFSLAWRTLPDTGKIMVNPRFYANHSMGGWLS